MINKTLIMMDSFCGTGTILRACYDIKTDAGISATDAIGSIWGSDKFSFPLQMSTLSLAKPEIMGQVINVFRSDVKDLEIGKEYEFTDPNNGQTITKALPGLDYIISNLPFVEASKIKLANPQIVAIRDRVAELLNEPGFSIPNKSDLLAYLPYYLWHLLNENGRLGLIVSNSWLGTDWGTDFRNTLHRFFQIKYVVTSGAGKWFQNADVVTNLLVLEKRPQPVERPEHEEETSFVIMQSPLWELTQQQVTQAANQTLLKRNGIVKVRTLPKHEMTALEEKGLNWSAYFADLSWFPTVENRLVPARTFFDINRGERRGWDPMFFPSGNHHIENEYLRPVLKNFRQVTRLIAEANGTAFCCSATEQELRAHGATGALAWIRHFQNATNEIGEPLTQSLARPGHYWYEMKDTTVADLVATINYGETIFIAKMEERSFVNQRLIRFTAVDDQVDIDLCHALMNSYLGIFYIEALGFGRGLGALDLSSTKVRDNLHMLDPNQLNEEQKKAIKQAFAPLFNREIETVPNEVDQADRVAFENVVAEVYGLDHVWNNIRSSLLDLFDIRHSVKG